MTIILITAFPLTACNKNTTDNSAKKITLSDEQVSTASKTEESTSAILALIDGMKVEKQIEEKFSKTVTVSTETEEKPRYRLY